MSETPKFIIFQILGMGKDVHTTLATVITPEPITHERMKMAWMYAIRHTPKELHVPDYDAALKMMGERHPTWNIIMGEQVARVHYDDRYDKQVNDTPDE